MEKQKRAKTGGRKPKNKEGVRITFTPSQEALIIYNSWDNKASNLDKAIINLSNDSTTTIQRSKT